MRDLGEQQRVWFVDVLFELNAPADQAVTR